MFRLILLSIYAQIPSTAQRFLNSRRLPSDFSTYPCESGTIIAKWNLGREVELLPPRSPTPTPARPCPTQSYAPLQSPSLAPPCPSPKLVSVLEDHRIFPSTEIHQSSFSSGMDVDVDVSHGLDVRSSSSSPKGTGKVGSAGYNDPNPVMAPRHDDLHAEGAAEVHSYEDQRYMLGLEE